MHGKNLGTIRFISHALVKFFKGDLGHSTAEVATVKAKRRGNITSDSQASAP